MNEGELRTTFTVDLELDSNEDEPRSTCMMCDPGLRAHGALCPSSHRAPERYGSFGELYVLFIMLFIPSIKRAQEGTTW